jgi:hypothetical protein
MELITFRDYIAPVQWGQIKVRGLASTSPDMKVVNGRLYLWSITPDSLRQFSLDYSEIYGTIKPTSEVDPMGVDLYIIKGKIIGKDHENGGKVWNPIIKVEEWHEVNVLINIGIKVFVMVQIVILLIFYEKNRSRSNKTNIYSKKLVTFNN